jgi:hypothetical protein
MAQTFATQFTIRLGQRKFWIALIPSSRAALLLLQIS